MAAYLTPSLFIFKDTLREVFGSENAMIINASKPQFIVDLLMKYLDVETIQTVENGTEQLGTPIGNPMVNENDKFFQLPIGSLKDLKFFNDSSSPENVTLRSCFSTLVEKSLNTYILTLSSYLSNAYETYPEENNFIQEKNGQYRKLFNNGENNKDEESAILNPIEELLNIHIPINENFWDIFTNAQGNHNLVVRVLFKIFSSISSSSVRREYSFLRDFKCNTDPKLLQEIVKLRVFNSQFRIHEIDFNTNNLDTLGLHLV